MARRSGRFVRAALVPLALAWIAGGCGGGTTETTGTDHGDGTILVAALGDSITAGSPLWDPDPQVREQIGPNLDERNQFEYWASKADPAITFRNCGVFGERTDQIVLRLQDCVPVLPPALSSAQRRSSAGGSPASPICI